MATFQYSECPSCHRTIPVDGFDHVGQKRIALGHTPYCPQCKRKHSRTSIPNLRKRSERAGGKRREKLLARLGIERAKRDALTAKRRCDEIKATPRWVDLRAIRAVYEECQRITRERCHPHHVDHIIPLRGKNVCGLHVPWNLRVITAEANIAKGNRHDTGR